MIYMIEFAYDQISSIKYTKFKFIKSPGPPALTLWFSPQPRELVDSGLGAEPKYKGWVLNQSVRAGGPGDFMNLNFVCLIDEI